MTLKRKLSVLFLSSILTAAGMPAGAYAAPGAAGAPVGAAQQGEAAAPGAVGGGGTSALDLPGHWASDVVGKWMQDGLVEGYGDGQVRPDAKITRAEFVALINRLFGFSGGQAASFNDVGADDWFAADAAAAQAAGIIEGGSDGAFRPGAPIERQEAAVIFSRAFRLSGGAAAPAFSDGDAVAAYAREAIAQLKAAGVLGGYEDGSVRPSSPITRAETLQLVDRLVGAWVTEGGTFTQPEVKGNVIVRAPDAVLDGTAIHGNLYLAPGIGTGKVKLSKVSVKGQTVVEGGGKVELSGSFQEIRLAAPVELTIGSQAEIGSLVAAEPGIRVNGKTLEVGTVYTVPKGGTVEVKDGKAGGSTGGGSSGGGDTGGGSTGGNTGGGAGGNTGGGGSVTDPWTLVWSDEFNGSALDRTKWTFDIGNGEGGWGNNELEYYTDRPENVKVENGQLVITGKKEDYQGFQYTSAKLKTKGLFSKKYGKFEVKAKFPTGKGYWPAIWMLPEDSVYGGWASSGEIDIMEGWGSRPDTIAGTIHYGQAWPNNTYTGKETKLENGSTINDFHTYGLEWEPGELRWYVDGKLYSTQNDWYSRSLNQPANNAYPAPFNEPFYMILNLAIGGHFDGNPTNETVFPGQMAVDYVRVYDLTGRPYREPIPPQLEKESLPDGARLPLPDGNLIYNSGFDSTVSPTEYWRLFQGEGGEGTLTVEPVDGSSFAKLSINNPGWQPYSVQLLNDVSLAKGRYYKLSFDAKASAPREVGVKLTGGASRGYAAYSQSQTLQLGTQLQHFDILFQMKQDTDIAARIEVNAGLNANTVWVGRMKLVEIDSIPFEHDVSKSPLADGNHLYNGTFDQGEPNRLSYWHSAVAGTASARFTVPEASRMLQSDISAGGAAKEDVVLFQRGVQLLSGQSYRLTFDAESDTAREIAVQLQKDGAEAARQSLTLPAGRSQQTMSFTMNQPSTDAGVFRFLLGGQAGQLKLDNVKLVRTSVYFDPDVVFYPLANGTFADGLDGWETATDSGGAVSGAASDGGAQLSITADGQNPWSNMFIQNGLSLFKGVTYTMAFDAKASIARKAQIIAENASYTRYMDQTVDLTTELQHYAFEFTMPKNETVSLKALLGKVANAGVGAPHTVFLDNVVLQVKDAPVAAPPRLRKDAADNKAGRPMELTFADDPAWRAAVSQVRVDGTVLAPSQYSLTSGKLSLDGWIFGTARSYAIRVEAAGYAWAGAVQDVLPNDGSLVTNGGFDNGLAEWSSWSGDGGAFSAAVKDGRAELAITAIGPNNWSNQFFHPGIVVEAGKTYELSFKASSSVPRSILVEYSNLQVAGPNQASFNLSVDEAVYTAAFKPTAAGTLKLNFLIGKIDGTTPADAVLKLDDVRIVAVEDTGTPPANDPGPVVTPPTGPVVPVGTNLIVNGSFGADDASSATEPTGWSSWWGDQWSGAAAGSATVETGRMKLQLDAIGGASYSPQIFQEGLQLEKGRSYTLSFKARTTSSDPRKINVNLGKALNADPWFTPYMAMKTETLSASEQLYTYTFTVTENTDSCKLVFEVGNIPDGNGLGDIFFDDVSLIAN